ncbi:MAG: MFS transporter, partial [Clostridia bacterium]|nr:MFS transporter [Clostridia bacterium]
TVMVTLGFCSSTKSLYLDVVTASLGIDRSLFSLNDTCRFVSNALVNLFFGALVHRFGAKRLMLAGILSLSCAMLCYATATNLVLFYLGGALLGVGFSFTGTTMVGCVIGKWCRENRGTVMGAVLAANGVGGAIAIQLLSPVIEGGGQQYRNAYFISGAAVLAVGVIILLLMREAPQAGAPHDAPVKHRKKRGRTWAGIPFSRAKTLPYFYVALACIFLTGFCLQGITGIAKAHMRDVGLSAEYVAHALSFHSLSLACFKFLTGFIYDRLGLRFTMSTCSLTASVVILLLSLVTDSSVGMVLAMLYSIFSSLALPLETIMLPIYAADLFGEHSYERILGIFVSVNMTGYALGAPLMNLCYDKLGTYTPMLLACAGIMLAVTLSMQVVISRAHGVAKAVES